MTKYNLTEKKGQAAYCKHIRKEMIDKLSKKIKYIIVNKKKYKDKDFSARQLASDIGTNSRYVSAVIRICFGCNYSEFVNKYRIEEAVSILENEKFDVLTMCDVSDLVGFANRQSFYAAFFKFKGMSPCDYKKQRNR